MRMNTNWEDIYDQPTDTYMRVSSEVLRHLGRNGVLQVALHLKAQNPTPDRRDAPRKHAYFCTAKNLQLFRGVELIKGKDGRVPVFVISTRESWEQWHLDRDRRN